MKRSFCAQRDVCLSAVARFRRKQHLAQRLDWPMVLSSSCAVVMAKVLRVRHTLMAFSA